MARVITQETFDEVVKENMEEFEMTQEEAVEEAKKQFQAQGVNLSNIIMTCSSAAVVSQCVDSLKRELATSYPDRDKNISQELSILRNELDKELAMRVLAGKQGLYPLLIECLNKMKAQHLLEVLETLTSLTNGYPDLLDKNGLDFMIAFLHAGTDMDLIIQDIKWMKNCVVKHEKNRADLIAAGVQDRFRNILKNFGDEAKLIVQVCQVVKRLVSDDDIRVSHGNAHEHARALARETLCSFVSFLEKYQDNPSVLNDVLQVISSLIVRDEFCVKVYEQNGLRFIMDAMVKYADDEKINRQCLLLLKGLAGNDQIKVAIIENGAASLVISSMWRHKSSTNLISAGCVCISAMALRSPSNSQALVEAGAAELLVSVLNIYKDNPVVLKNGCWAIRNLVARNREFRRNFLDLNAETLLTEARKNFQRELDYEVGIALRDLGLKTEDSPPFLSRSSFPCERP